MNKLSANMFLLNDFWEPRSIICCSEIYFKETEERVASSEI